jgi:hypothetical protein
VKEGGIEKGNSTNFGREEKLIGRKSKGKHEKFGFNV